VGAHAASQEPPLAVDEIRRRWPKDSVALSGNLATAIDQYGGGVAALSSRALDEVGTLAERDQSDLEAAVTELPVEGVHGR
jgi:hypothetical protein